MTGPYTLAAGVPNLTVDAGFYQPTSLGDFVWNDLNANGQQDASEPGLAGSTVTLWRCGPDGLVGTGDDVNTGQSQVTPARRPGWATICSPTSRRAATS